MTTTISGNTAIITDDAGTTQDLSIEQLLTTPNIGTFLQALAGERSRLDEQIRAVALELTGRHVDDWGMWRDGTRTVFFTVAGHIRGLDVLTENRPVDDDDVRALQSLVCRHDALQHLDALYDE